MTKMFLELIKLIYKKLHKNKQLTVKAENSIVILITINKDWFGKIPTAVIIFTYQKNIKLQKINKIISWLFVIYNI